MACTFDLVETELKEKAEGGKVLVVGAGGIGCELLKNLVLTGFKNIEIIDLDTIDVSNLNRQFLFQKVHVGKSKASVARESALLFNPTANIKAYHDSITSTTYNVNFFKQFSLVMNALDNRAARNHVNRMCLAADVPLIESGTAGYSGQVEVIKKGLTECYECVTKPSQKNFPSCTIRNTPSEPIHCIVWGKHLFNQLFGEDDPDEDVSPDTEDPEAVGDAGQRALDKVQEKNEENASESSDSKPVVERKSTREWARSCGYNVKLLFHKLFHDDIKYLLSLHHLWEKRRPPTPLTWDNLPDAVPGSSRSEVSAGLKDQRIWSIAECADIFGDSVNSLKKQLEKEGENGNLIWDKDDDVAMDFVTACANIRAHIFGISQTCRFDVKSMAGNIIPAIATSNAIIAGVIVLHALKILRNKIEDCKSVYLRLQPNPRKRVLVSEQVLNKPNEKCYICSPKHTVTLCVDVNKMTVGAFEELVLKKGLHMVAPDMMIHGKDSVLISSEDEELNENKSKTLAECGVTDGALLDCDDFLQNYDLTITVSHREMGRDDPEFVITSDPDALKPKELDNTTKKTEENDDDDDLTCIGDAVTVSDSEEEHVLGALKRKSMLGDNGTDDISKSKRLKVASEADHEIIIL
ncbi:SUMO-activating enzyme subunit 2 [Ischnura elegans]|uniref:SUMO-activating enzyme subunit 2 n=1 Tax=Ischnura elegans TaxID=197161 RepID=UPI001ED872AB|nr:SUMO-activating enzyme subunit 2 [Ischnura elegans]